MWPDGERGARRRAWYCVSVHADSPPCTRLTSAAVTGDYCPFSRDPTRFVEGSAAWSAHIVACAPDRAPLRKPFGSRLNNVLLRTNDVTPNPTDPLPTHDRGWLGSLLLFGGIALLVLCVIEAATGLRGMPRAWYGNRPLWWVFALASIAAGAYWLAPVGDRVRPTRWRPSRNGLRFRQLMVYTRAGCHLCDDALELLAAHRRWLPDAVVVDIDTDPRLVEKYGTCVPVVLCDGKVRFRGRVSPELLRRLIEWTPPL
jgi:glutaredoxin